MNHKLSELEAEAEIVEMESRKALELQEIQLQVEEAERSYLAMSIYPSLLSLVLDEDKNSDIQSWLEHSDENFAEGFSQPKSLVEKWKTKVGGVVCLKDFQHILIRKINLCHRNLKVDVRVSQWNHWNYFSENKRLTPATQGRIEA